MDKIIKVTGTGKISVKPDLTVITLDFSKIMPTYNEAVESSSRDVAIVKDALEKAGLKRDSLKTINFDVDTHYESYRDEHNDYRSRFDGYEYHQTLRFKFPIDNKMLGKVLYEIGSIDVHPRFRIHYELENPEEAKNQLLSNAINDAKKKAEVIANASSLALDEILEINYTWVNIEMVTRSFDVGSDNMFCKSEINCGSCDIDIEPEDIEKNDNVTVIYKVK